eukprot:Rhum_TRINITY_DN8667_c0_g1::Rhum_TRINITY_DN8667_c0_g1_i1::g.29288::m.29288
MKKERQGAAAADRVVRSPPLPDDSRLTCSTLCSQAKAMPKPSAKKSKKKKHAATHSPFKPSSREPAPTEPPPLPSTPVPSPTGRGGVVIVSPSELRGCDVTCLGSPWLGTPNGNNAANTMVYSPVGASLSSTVLRSVTAERERAAAFAGAAHAACHHPASFSPDASQLNTSSASPVRYLRMSKQRADGGACGAGCGSAASTAAFNVSAVTPTTMDTTGGGVSGGGRKNARTVSASPSQRVLARYVGEERAFEMSFDAATSPARSGSARRRRGRAGVSSSSSVAGAAAAASGPVSGVGAAGCSVVSYSGEVHAAMQEERRLERTWSRSRSVDSAQRDRDLSLRSASVERRRGYEVERVRRAAAAKAKEDRRRQKRWEATAAAALSPSSSGAGTPLKPLSYEDVILSEIRGRGVGGGAGIEGVSPLKAPVFSAATARSMQRSASLNSAQSRAAAAERSAAGGASAASATPSPSPLPRLRFTESSATVRAFRDRVLPVDGGADAAAHSSTPRSSRTPRARVVSPRSEDGRKMGREG